MLLKFQYFFLPIRGEAALKRKAEGKGKAKSKAANAKAMPVKVELPAPPAPEEEGGEAWEDEDWEHDSQWDED